MTKFLARFLLGLALIFAAAAPSYAAAPFPEQGTWAGTSGGSANAQTLTVANYRSRLTNVKVSFFPGFVNTGPATLNISATGSASIMKPSQGGLVALSGRELQTTQLTTVTWDGSEWVLYYPLVNPQMASISRNLIVTTASNTTFTVTAGSLTVEDTNGFGYRLANVSVTCTITNSGANGLDTGSATSSTWYGGYVIYNPGTQTTACLASLHPTSFTDTTGPTMPAGYTARQYVTEMRYDAASKFVWIKQFGRQAQVVIGTNPTVGLIAASGISGSLTTPTYTTTSVASLVPPTASAIKLYVTEQTGTGGVGVILAPNGSYGAYNSATNPPPFTITNPGSTTYIRVPFWMTLETLNIFYASNDSNDVVYCLGWELNL